MKRSMMAAVIVSLSVLACGPGSPGGTGGSGGIGGAGGAGGATSASSGGATASSTSASSSSSGAGGTPATLTTDCVGSALILAAPLDASDGITNANGVPYHEAGAWAARCFLPPSYPFAVDKFLYSVGLTAQGGPCSNSDVDHDVVIFAVPSLPATYAEPMATIHVPSSMFTFDINSKADLAIDVPPGVVIDSGYVCAAVVENIVDPTSRTCTVACDQQTAESPDLDYWTVDGADGMVNCDASGCFLIPFDVSPDPQLGQMFGLNKWRFLYSIEGRTL